MDEALWWIVDILGPVLLLAALVWLVLRSRSRGENAQARSAEQGTRNLYAEEEQRRREGTDDL